MLEAVLDALFPKRCAGCAGGAWPFCRACRQNLIPLTPPQCARCGLPAEHPLPRCPGCPPGAISVARAPFLFRGAARAAVHRLKFSGWRVVAEALGAAMASVNAFDADAVTWVPLSRARLAERGYDQARALAVAVGGRLDLPAPSLLTRAGSRGRAQARRSGAERRSAVRDAFRVGSGPVPARLLLVDDVLTTGATAAACATALRQAGAREVGLLTATRAGFGPLPARCYNRVGPCSGLWLPGDGPR